MTPDELKARLMAAWHKGIIAEEEASFVESLINIVIEQQAALEKYSPYCVIQTGPENDKGLMPFLEVWLAKETLNATRERLKAWVGE